MRPIGHPVGVGGSARCSDAVRCGLLAAATHTREPSLLLATPLAGCISLAAPEKPIEINLNVKIEQEVVVRLQRDVEQIIKQNPQDFPQPTKPGGQP